MDGMTYIPTVKAELFALDLQSGEIKWSVDEPWSFPRSVAGRTETVFVQDPTGVVRAFNASSGDVLWRRDHDPGFLDNTPTVVGDAVYLTGLDTLFRLDATDGDRVWSTDLTRVGGVDSVSANSETVLGISSNGFVFAIDADTGETLWSRDVAGFVMTAPVVVDSVMYTGTRDWRLMAIQVAKNATNLPLDAPGHNNGTGATEDARLPGGKDASSVRSGIAVAVLGAAAIMARRDRNAPR